MDFLTRYNQLNERQREAVDTLDGPVMVVAGPGTGKTELLGVRIAAILKNTDTPPQSILCLTFTDSGAAAMRQRLVDIIGKDAYKVAIHTFHSFGSEVINHYREYFYRGAEFKAADDVTRYQIIRGILASLDHNSPLATTMNGEYTHQSDVAETISHLKRSGLTSDELRAVLEQNEAALNLAERVLVPIFADGIKKGIAEKISENLDQLQKAANETPSLYELTPLIRVIYDSLVSALDACAQEHPTKPLTAWKNAWLKKNRSGTLEFSSRSSIAKLRAVSYVYYEYMQAMERAGLFDYDDMILQVVHAMEVHDDLRFTLQEKYLYLMIDEFQDTNLAQLRIMHALTNTTLDNDPNILVVGDDDQAIYSFQGADISNILSFREHYPNAHVITLTDNYRSGEPILAQSREVIVQGADRLETIMHDINKQLTAHRTGEATVRLTEHHRLADELSWVVNEVHGLLHSGVPASEIALLTKKHSELQALVPYLHARGIRVQYERHDNALESEPVRVLMQLARCIMALSKGDHSSADALLPELLAHPAWGLSPEAIWKLSIAAYDARTRWMTTMETMPGFTELHGWLLGRVQHAATQPLEQMLDSLIGKPNDEEEQAYRSPLYEHFFGHTRLESEPQAYLDYLTAISTIRSHVRDYTGTSNPTLEQFLDFIDLHESLGSGIRMNRHVLEDDSDAIHLMTAHSSKGLEFEHVFIVGATDATWGEKARGRSRLIKYPENMPLAPAGNTPDERLRLFYVAMTRAKKALTISYATETDSGKQLLRASFLSQHESTPIEADQTIQARVAQAETAWHVPYTETNATLKELLNPRLARYTLSATHLNHFLDVTRGGPQTFLLNNLLHFPSAKSDSAGYGSAIHRTLQNAHTHVLATGEQKPLEDILHDFSTQLSMERIDPARVEYWLQKGSDDLQSYIRQHPDAFKTTQRSELNFNNQDVHIGDAHITGLLDLTELNDEEKTIIVTDYKTGKPVDGRSGMSEYDKIKIHKYRQQLLFYKLLVEGSRDYAHYKVTEGCIQFIEPAQNGESVSYNVSLDDEEVDRTARLIRAVWRKITTLDLPDISAYEPTLKGILQFEEDLLAEADTLTN